MDEPSLPENEDDADGTIEADEHEDKAEGKETLEDEEGSDECDDVKDGGIRGGKTDTDEGQRHFEECSDIEADVESNDDQNDNVQSPDPAHQNIREKDDEMEGKKQISDNEDEKYDLEVDGTVDVEAGEEDQIRTPPLPPSTQNDKHKTSGELQVQEDDKKKEIVDSEDDNEENELIIRDTTSNHFKR
ncbi:hypothetical protein BLNAU_20620 [Blattamonas nauphoetae]|uniref:Uncharacterized protein n=1 Tax=Blattamonas nauphoetae TaxID=2049346 RepID=A0ABQ9X0J4_9EUKA|nr:hypothetical protein BLNAU_20620 [Blattamonas nauphoetae]